MITEFNVNVIPNLKQLQCDSLRVICNKFGFSVDGKLMCSLIVEAYKQEQILDRETVELTYRGELDPKQVIIQTALSLFADKDGIPLALAP